MLRDGFYHCCFAVMLLAGALDIRAAEPTVDAGVDETTIHLPPRSINDITRMLGDYKQNDDQLRKLRVMTESQAPKTEDRKVLFDFYWQRGQAATELGQIQQQIDDLRLAVHYGERGSPEYSRSLRVLSQAERLGGNFLSAKQYAEEAIKLVPQNNQGQLVGIYAQVIGLASQVGDFEMAQVNLAKLESVLAELRKAKNWNKRSHFWLAPYEKARGDYFSMAGKMVEAEAAYRKSLRERQMGMADLPTLQALGQDGGNTLEKLQQANEGVERGLAKALQIQGKMVEAEAMARTALEHTLKRAGRSSPDVGRGLRVLANIIAEQGRYAESAKLSEAALDAALTSGAAPNSLTVLGALRSNLSAQVALGNDVKALDFYARIGKAVEGSPELAAQVLRGDLDVVQALLRTGQPEAAEKMAVEMLERLRQRLGERSLRTSEVRAFYAMALADRGDRAGALTAFRLALPVLVERARSDSEAETGSMRRQQRLVGILERYIRLLSEMPGAALPNGFDAANDAFVMADLARGSSVQRALTRSAARAAIKDTGLAQLARDEQDAQRRSNTLNDLLSQLLAAPPEQQLPAIQARIREDIEALKQRRTLLKKEISQRFPDYAQLVDPPPVNISDVVKMLHPGEALISWYFGQKSAQVWAITADGRSRFAALPTDRTKVAVAIASLRKSLDADVLTIEQIPPFNTGLAYRLYQDLFAPVVETLSGAKTLLVVPHGELGQLPLSLLVTAPTTQPLNGGVAFSNYRQVPWLMRQLAIAQLPSVTSLASLRRLPSGISGRLPFIGFGDPYFSEEQARQAGKNVPLTQIATRGLPLRLRSVPRTQSVDSAELALLPRLPDTAEEIREIAKTLGADPARDIFLNLGASEKTVFEANLANRKVVMFATHGLVPGELNGLTQPALALSAPGLTGAGGDGLLTQEEILTLKLNADWVVLSACNTAAGEGSGSEAVSGLGRAFFYAGARALLVSNWPVETEAARSLMTDLFRRQSVDPALGKAEALRQAMLGMLDGQGKLDGKTGKPLFSYAHPLFWAPFALIGD